MSLRPQAGRRWLPLSFCLAALAACQPAPPPARALYYWGGEVNVACPCGTSQCFWVRGTPAVLERLRGFVQAETSRPYQPVFLRYRGERLAEPTSGFAADYDGYLRIDRIESLSPTLPDDCPAE